MWRDIDDHEGEWCPIGDPVPLDFPTAVRIASFITHVEDLFGATGTKHRSSMRPRGRDIMINHELSPGELGERPRPRYE